MAAFAHRAALGLAVVVALIAIGAGLYLLVSFLVMRRHTTARPLASALRSMLHEALAIAITQPLIPLYYVVGRRMGGRREGRPVVFVHGYFQNRADFLYLARAARRAHLGPLYGFNYDWTESIPTCADRLAAFVESVCGETGQAAVALVAHSLGGVICLEYLSRPEGAARVARCVTIASPHAGVVWEGGMIGKAARQLAARSAYMQASAARPLTVPVLSIFSTHDNIVHPPTTSALASRGGDDCAVDEIGHLGMLFSPEVARITVRVLAV